jgi:glycosyltransferase involved in cell wall biosynthesis
MKKLRIAMMGLKGIPGKWGGHEIYAQEVGRRLVRKGHDVTVFCYSNYNTDFNGHEYEGIKIRWVYAGPYRPIESLVGGLSSTIRVFGHGFDVVHFHGYGSFYYIPLLKCMGIKTFITAHMYDSAWNNPKWGVLARWSIKTGFEIGIRHADYVSTVASYIQKIIRNRYSIASEVIYSGTDAPVLRSPEIISEKYGLTGDDYILFIGRLDKIKRADLLLKAYMMAGSCRLKLVIAGGAADTSGFEKELHRLANGNRNIIFTGFVYDKIKEELFSNAAFVVSPSVNEGLPITVIESANYAKACLVSDIPGHREVIAREEPELLFFNVDDVSDLSRKLQRLSDINHGALEAIGTRLHESVTKQFNWDVTTEKVEAAYRELVECSQGRSHTNNMAGEPK